ncbi:TIR domain-containing protein [Shewanella baltica]|uniref:TIR domain-containing protein n=1 Tax=Shewanella baltica TaxID=62322 RepID=UPI00217D046A|nr:TIR domain-containing protein [Shewanella baltica]
MSGNYCAFYVAEPFHEGALGAHATKDFVYYNTLRMWKGADSSFPFSNSHDTTYNVRDGSSWEDTLKPRLRARLRNSKNIILFLSERTVNSRALREEIDYGINTLGLPVIVIYPDYNTKESLLLKSNLKQEIVDLWNKIPTFRDSMYLVPTVHVPMSKALISQTLTDSRYVIKTKAVPDIYTYK